jgi:hypothetical protein
MQSHHPEQRAALAKHIAGHDPEKDPRLLMSGHSLTFKGQVAQHAAPDFAASLGTPGALQEAATLMEKASVAPATAGQKVLEHANYLFGLTPLKDVSGALKAAPPAPSVH